MAIKITRDRNRIPKLIRSMNALKNKSIEAGVLTGGKQAMIARVHEFGVNIRVTPKMRAYLRTIGIYLKNSTTHIRIPERSFVRAGWDKYKSQIESRIDKGMEGVVELSVDPNVFLKMIGELTADRIKDYIEELSYPPNHPATIRQKGSSSPLIDTGSLRDSIDYRVK